MDKTADKLIFRRREFQHLKPLSVYSKMMISDEKATVDHYPNPFINFKIEIRNNCVKRKLDDSSIDECYETPAKKSVCPKAVSLDLGCFADCCSPTARQDSIKIEIKQTVSPRLLSEPVECWSSEPQRLGDNALTKPHSSKSEKVPLNVAPAFDGDIDHILCPNPIGFSTAGRLSDTVESGKSPSSNLFHNAAVVLGQELERGDSQMEGEGEERKKDQNVKYIEDDRGYFSMSYIRDHKAAKDPSQLESPQPPQASSRALLIIDEVEASEVEGQPDRCEPSCHKQATLSVQYVSFIPGNSDPVVSGSAESMNSPIEPLEVDAEEVWNIGFPIFESSMCHNVSANLSDWRDQSRQALEGVQGGMIEPSQMSRDGEETTLDTSYETTLPLQMQVKSVVVVPHQHPVSSKPSAGLLLKQTAEPTNQRPKEIRVSQNPEHVSRARSQRPSIFDNELELERDKLMYFHAVTRHLNENLGVTQDAVTELHSLMTHVADTSTTGTQWQHPSDLTHRNYQRKFGNLVPTVTLSEWQAKNGATHRRFANVPKIFQRSEFP